METFSDFLIKIKRKNNFKDYFSLLQTFEKILFNLTENPNNEKFYKLSAKKDKIVSKNILEVDGGIEFLHKLGFFKHVEKFEPFYIRKEKLAGRKLLMFEDMYTSIKEELQNLEKRKQSVIIVNNINTHKKQIQSNVEKIMMHYDEDRLEKEKHAKIEHERIRKRKENEKKKLAEKLIKQRKEALQKREYDQKNKMEQIFSVELNSDNDKDLEDENF